MTEFYVGDRVRVRPKIGRAHSGRAGSIVMVERSFSGGPAVSYQVRLDDAPAHPCGSHVTFDPKELEPAQEENSP